MADKEKEKHEKRETSGGEQPPIENEKNDPDKDPKPVFTLEDMDGLEETETENEDEENQTDKNDTYTVKEVKVASSKSKAHSEIDREALAKIANENAVESDKEYRKQTDRIISITDEQLKAHTNAKKPLRIILMCFVILLLSCQFAALVFILFLNQAKNLKISDFVINVYIVSLFVETLTGLIIMIKFAFDSKQEVTLIQILNSIVRHFKKYGEK